MTKKQEESWEVRYVLVNAADRLTVAQGRIRDYPSAEEAMDRLGERVGTAVAAELRSLADPAPWRLVLSFEIVRRCDPLTVAELAEQLATAGPKGKAPFLAPEDFFGKDSGIDLDAALEDGDDQGDDRSK